MFLIPLWYSIKNYNKIIINSKNKYYLEFSIYISLLVLFIGLRFEVGGDWYNYSNLIESVKDISLFNGLKITDPAYSLINWISAYFNFAQYLPNLICAIIFGFGLFKFCITQPAPWLALTISIPYLVIVVAMGYTRQSVAIGLVMLALIYIEKNKLFFILFYLILATLFHKSAIVILPFILFSGKRAFIGIIGIIFIGILLYISLIQENIESLYSGYILDQYDSSGALVRILMCTMPGIIFLLFRKKFNLSIKQLEFWTWFAIGSLSLIPLFYLSPSSTAVDRIALYWIPLQIFVLSRLPSALSYKNIEHGREWLFIILFYSFLIQFIWLFYADYRSFWLPYKFLLWEYLWN